MGKHTPGDVGGGTGQESEGGQIKDLARFPSENPNPVLRVSKDGVLLHANESSRILLRTWGAKLGSPLPAEWDMRVKEAVLSGKDQHAEVNCGGRFFSLCVTPVEAEKYVNIYASDITQRRRMADELEESNKALREALDRLKQAQQRTIQYERLSALGQMASGIAHDFNNALMPIMGLSEFLLLHQELWRDKEEMESVLRDIHMSAKDATQIVQRLRSFYKPSDGELFIPVELDDVIRHAIDLTRPRWKEEMAAQGVDVDMRIDLQSEACVDGSASELREAFVNLILNAVDALPKGGGVVTVQSWTTGKMALVDVTDTGAGMTGEIQRRCFEPFFSTKGPAGTGLGLSMVYGMAKRHNGAVTVHSTGSEGTVLRMVLPIAGSTQGEITPTPDDVGPDPERLVRILVVDDDERTVRLVAKFLRVDGHDVVTANSAEEGLKRARDGGYDLIITDRAMPSMSGDDLVAAIREFDSATPVVLLTGFGEIMKQKGEVPPGVNRIVSKPVTLKDLRYVLAKEMGWQP